MILGMTEMWVVLIASSAAPLWPLFRLRATIRSQNTPYAYGSSAGAGFSNFQQSKYRKAEDGTITDGTDETEMYHLRIGAGKVGSRSESQEAIVPGDRIMLTHDISISHDNFKRPGGMV